mgnify:CR=1 FL=1
MAESTLSLTQTRIREEVSFYLNSGRRATVAAGLSAAQNSNVNAAVEAGEARFAGAHDWGFLRPRADLTLWPTVTGVANTAVTTTVTATTAKFYSSMVGHSIVFTTGGSRTITAYTDSTHVTVSANTEFWVGNTFTITADGIYRLPDDFGGMESTQIPFERDAGNFWFIDVVAEPLIVQAWQLNDATGRPRRAATRPVANVGTGQRWDLITEPIPDASYPVSFRYNKLPNAMSATDYGSGGLLFSDALLKCCLAAAEEKFRENQNVMAAQEEKALAKAIRFDLRYNRARKLGHTTTSNFRDNDRAMESRATGFVYRGTTVDVE